MAAVRSSPRTRGPGDAGAGARRPTIRDVAKAAGVSQSTTSRALRNQGYVAAEVRERVQRAATKLGYVPDVLARHLRQQVSHSIGVLVSDLRNSFYADLAAGASRAARRAGYTVMLIDDRLLAEEEAEASEAFASMRVAGVVLTPLSAGVSHYLQQRQIPVVEVDRQFAADSCDAVVVDNRVAAAALTEHLIDLGHRRIALLVDEAYWTTGRERVRGYEQALLAHGIAPDPALMVSSGWDVAGAREVTLGLLEGEAPPTAIFAANNVLAEGVWRAAGDLGLRLPEELSIVSFDEAPWMSMVTPGLTTVRQDGVALGEAAVVRLLERIEAPSAPISTLVFRAEVTVRGSSAPLTGGHPSHPADPPRARDRAHIGSRQPAELLNATGKDRSE
jgi:LacI family transcriptional regulator